MVNESDCIKTHLGIDFFITWVIFRQNGFDFELKVQKEIKIGRLR